MTKHSINIIGDIEDQQLMSGISLLIEMGYPVTIKRLGVSVRTTPSNVNAADKFIEAVQLCSNTQAPKAAQVTVKKIPMGTSGIGRKRFCHPSGKTSTDILMSYVERAARSGHKTRMEDLAKYMRGEGFARNTVYVALSAAVSADKVVSEGGYVWWKEGAR